jgi:hypothetical protein
MPQSAKRQLKDVAMPSATDMEMGAPPAKEASAIARPLSELTYYLACDSVWLERVGEAVIQDLQVNKSRYVPGETARQVGKGRVVVCAATVCGKESDQEKLFCHTGAWPQTLAGVLKWLMPAERATLRMPLNPGDAKDPRLAQLAGLSKVDVEGVLDDLAPKRPAKGSKKGLSAFESIRKAAVPCGGLLQARAVVKALADSQTAFGARDAEELLGAIEPYIQGDEFLPWATTMVASGNSGQTALGMRVLGRLQAPGLRPVATEIMVKFSVLAVCPLSHKGRGCR